MSYARNIFTGLSALCMSVLPSYAAAQEWPIAPITWIVAVPPGGALDTTARLLQEPVSKILGQPIVVENRPGGGHLVGAEATVQAAPDGYTFGTVASPFITNSWLLADIGYDPLSDVEPVACFWSAPSAISVHPAQPYMSFEELLADAAERPGELTYGTPGVGTSMHIAGELLSLSAGVDFVHVPYRGAGPALTDAVAGNVPMAITNVQSTAPFAVENSLRALATTGAERSRLLPDVPTVAELGFPDFSVTEWYCLVAPAGTDGEIIHRMNDAVREVLEYPEIQERYDGFGFEYEPMTPAQVGEFFEQSHEMIGRVISEAGIVVE